MSASLLTTMGIQELIAPSLDAHGEMAVALRTDAAKLDSVMQSRTESKWADKSAFVANLGVKLMQVFMVPLLAERE